MSNPPNHHQPSNLLTTVEEQITIMDQCLHEIRTKAHLLMAIAETMHQEMIALRDPAQLNKLLDTHLTQMRAEKN